MGIFGLESSTVPVSLQAQRSHINRVNIAQTLPPDILILIVDITSTCLNEAYAPLICSHVCKHWREIIVGAPSLWTYVDTSRGMGLTRLWLMNAKDAMLNVRLWGSAPPEKILRHIPKYLTTPPSPFSTADIAILEVKQRISQWRSLNISSACISDTSEIIKSLGNLPETLLLDYLTIGPADQTIVVIDDGTVVSSPSGLFPLADSRVTRSLFGDMNVQPSILRVDTYPIAFSPIVFSPRLTVFEVFTGGHYTHIPDAKEWHEILSHTSQLVQLRLWSSRHRPFDPLDPTRFTPLQLPCLQRLDLSGTYTMLCPLFTQSLLPQLDYLSLDFVGSPICMPQQLVEFASISPALTQLQVGSACFNPTPVNSTGWAKAFRSMNLLQTLRFVETEWREIAVALEQLSAIPHNVTSIKLKGIWDLDVCALSQLLAPETGLPFVELVDCVDGPDGRCTNPETIGVCESESGSYYTDNDSFDSEESEDSTDSEMSSGDDEGSNMRAYVYVTPVGSP
ncbi:hypothetical protein FS749_004007 [Ceratobasidium sp. UAMH 11750]|nr:hypothetical protein FS749_004007 [Ceratobasidium sp. UAMH 11750]